jgi:DNA-binding response OmpR family regulator
VTEKPRILVVDDELDVRETLADYLALHGFSPEPLDGGSALRARVADGAPFDIVLLDITMPGEDGLSLARWLREVSRAGIVMVTAHGDPIDRVVGLEVGADDYIPKPVELRELVARIRALMRRMAEAAFAAPAAAVQAATHAVAAPQTRRMAVGEMILDLDARRLLDADGRDVPLTAMEFDLLQVLAERPDRVLSREQLLELSHKDPDEPLDRSIDIRIARLRRKIERDPARPEIIKTVRGVGYVFARRPG